MMRRVVVLACSIVGLLGIASPAGAQVQDTTARGVTTAPRDSVRALAMRLEVGGVLPHLMYGSPTFEIATDFGGAARAAVEYRFDFGVGTFAMLGGSVMKVEQRQGGLETFEGTAMQYDVMAGFTWQPPIRQRSPEPVKLHVAGGGAWLSMPDESIVVAPGGPPRPLASINDQDQPVPVWEVGLSVRPSSRPLAAVAVLQMTKVLPSAADENVWAQRLIVALRIGS